MHNLPKGIRLSLARDAKPASPAVRAAGIRDVPQIWELVSTYSARGLLLPRTAADIAAKLDDYVVAADDCGRVLACASLEEYSPSLGEVASVAVAAAEHGKGLGTQVVRGIERLALARGINELFALSLTGDFFLSMGYELTTTSRYPEKLARYETLRSGGVEIIPKPCFKKQLDADWSAPQRYAEELPRRRMAG